MWQRFSYGLKMQLVSWGLPHVDESELMDESIVLKVLNEKVFADRMHIGTQLHLGSFFGTFYQSLGGSP
jgi:hypothetical protein